MSRMSADYENNDFEDDFEDDLGDGAGGGPAAAYMLRPKLSANLENAS